MYRLYMIDVEGNEGISEEVYDTFDEAEEEAAWARDGDGDMCGITIAEIYPIEVDD